MPLPRLRPMTPADVAPASAAILADDWGDRRRWFEFAVASPHCRTFVAEDEAGQIAGTGVATLNGPVAWIGTIWVAPAWRGHGLGRALTQAPIDAAEAAGCRSLVLVATQAGQPLYERMGFTVQAWYRTMEAPGLAGTPGARLEAAGSSLDAVGMIRGAPSDGQDRVVRAWRADDLPAMAELDATVTGEDRRHLLEAFAAPDSALVLAGTDDRLRGFVVRAPWGGGATIAPDIDDAMALLTARRTTHPPDRRIRAGIIADNEAGAARLEADGWTEAWRAPRLVRGEPLTWAPGGIWGQFNHAVG